MKSYESMTVKDLRAYAKDSGIVVPSKARKAEIIDAIVTAERERMAEDSSNVAPVAEDSANVAELPTYENATGDEIDSIIGGMVVEHNTAHKLLNAIREGIAESGAYLLNDGHVCQGVADMAIGVYVGRTLVYVLPMRAHGTRVCPATVYGDMTDAPAWYAQVSANEATDAIRKDPDSAKRYAFITGADGARYAVKTNAHGAPIGKKYPMAKYIRMVGTCVSTAIYEAYHLNNINWRNARNIQLSVKPIRDLVINS